MKQKVKLDKTSLEDQMAAMLAKAKPELKRAVRAAADGAKKRKEWDSER